MPIPAELNTPAFRAALETYQAERKGGRSTVGGLRLILRDLVPHGVDMAIRAVEQSTKARWLSIDPSRLNANSYARNGSTSSASKSSRRTEPAGFDGIRDFLAQEPA